MRGGELQPPAGSGTPSPPCAVAGAGSGAGHEAAKVVVGGASGRVQRGAAAERRGPGRRKLLLRPPGGAGHSLQCPIPAPQAARPAGCRSPRMCSGGACPPPAPPRRSSPPTTSCTPAATPPPTSLPATLSRARCRTWRRRCDRLEGACLRGRRGKGGGVGGCWVEAGRGGAGQARARPLADLAAACQRAAMRGSAQR